MSQTIREVSFSQANKGLGKVLQQVDESGTPTLIKREHGADVMMLSLRDYNGLMETLHLLRSSANAEHLARSIAQYREIHASKVSDLNQ